MAAATVAAPTGAAGDGGEGGDGGDARVAPRRLLDLLVEQRGLRDEVAAQRVLMGKALTKLAQGEVSRSSSGKKKKKAQLQQVETAMNRRLDALLAQYEELGRSIKSAEQRQDEELRFLAMQDPSFEDAPASTDRVAPPPFVDGGVLVGSSVAPSATTSAAVATPAATATVPVSAAPAGESPSFSSAPVEHAEQRFLRLSEAEAEDFKRAQRAAYQSQQTDDAVARVRGQQHIALMAGTGGASPAPRSSPGAPPGDRASPRRVVVVSERVRRLASLVEAELAASSPGGAPKAAAAAAATASSSWSSSSSSSSPPSRTTATAAASPSMGGAAASPSPSVSSRGEFVLESFSSASSAASSPGGSGDLSASAIVATDPLSGYITDLESETQRERLRQARAVTDLLRRASGGRHLLKWEQIAPFVRDEDGAGSASGAAHTATAAGVGAEKQLLGEGAFARVYRGELAGQPVAIKVLKQLQSDKSLRSFVREVALMENLATSSPLVRRGELPVRQNPHLVRFVGAVAGPEPGRFAIVTELCRGGSLHDALHRRHVRFSVRHILGIATHLALALASLHRGDVIHRDVTTHNILLFNECHGVTTFAGGSAMHGGEEPVIQLCDLGIARMHTRPDAGGKGKVEQPSSLPPRKHMSPIGNPRWVAPEVVRREPYDRQVDVWSYGMVLAELLTNRLPYASLDTDQDILRAISSGAPPVFPDNTEPHLRDVALQCLSPDPARRPKLFALVRHLTRLRYTIPESRLDMPAMHRHLDLSPSHEALFKQEQIRKYEEEQQQAASRQATTSSSSLPPAAASSSSRTPAARPTPAPASTAPSTPATLAASATSPRFAVNTFLDDARFALQRRRQLQQEVLHHALRRAG